MLNVRESIARFRLWLVERINTGLMRCPMGKEEDPMQYVVTRALTSFDSRPAAVRRREEGAAARTTEKARPGTIEFGWQSGYLMALPVRYSYTSSPSQTDPPAV